jgi:uncharacterized protein (TIRG00374 family)
VKQFVVAMLVVGIALLGVILYQTDLSEAWERLVQIGWGGVAWVMVAYFVGFLFLTAAWQVTLPTARASARWLYRLWKVLMVGAALDVVTPLAGLGGEPVKAALLKKHYGIQYREGAASLVLARMTDLIAQVIFIATGFALMFRADLVPSGYRMAAAAGLGLFTVAIVLFFLVQRGRAFSWLRAHLEGGWLGRRLGDRAVGALDGLRDVEDRLVGFYSAERLRFGLSVGFALGDWMCETTATYIAVNLLGFPIDFFDAMVIESFVILVRSTLFFVPADLGTQEGAQVLICGAITGSPALGLALAAIRRARDLLWIAWGLGIGSRYLLSRQALLEEARLEAEASVECVEGDPRG